MNSEIIEMHAIIFGRVQGVGFRWTVTHHATHLGITGTVRNMPNGSVEILAQGTREQLDELIQHIQHNAGIGHVDSVKTDFTALKQRHDHFSIVK